MPQHSVISPLPGVFYRRPAPDQPLYVESGQTVEPDTTIGLVEIMKQFVEVKAGVAGTLVSFEVENEGMLNPGDVVAFIEGV